MKITIEPTGTCKDTGDKDTSAPTVIISSPYDDYDIYGLLEDLIKPALIAFGYHTDTVEKLQVKESDGD